MGIVALTTRTDQPHPKGIVRRSLEDEIGDSVGERRHLTVLTVVGADPMIGLVLAGTASPPDGLGSADIDGLG
jgi:hypothetical protein